VPASIPSPPASGFHVGPFDLHAYGLMYVVALLAAIAITVRRWEAAGGSRTLVYDVAIWGFPAGLIGGRLYFLATSWSEVPAHWWGPLAVWDGGLGIWGGIALGSAVGLWRVRRAGVSPGPFLDAAAPALLVAQALGRIGNYFNQELFGGPTSLPWALQISPAHRPLGYESFTTFHPTFLYELIWNLALAAFLVWLGHHRRIKPPGLFALYVAGYSAFRIFEESLRVDPAHHILGLRLNFYVACLLTIAGAAWFVAIQRRGRTGGGRRARGATLIAIGWATFALAGCAHGSRASAAAGPEPEARLEPAAVRSAGESADHRVGVGLLHLHVGRAAGAGRAIACATFGLTELSGKTALTCSRSISATSALRSFAEGWASVVCDGITAPTQRQRLRNSEGFVKEGTLSCPTRSGAIRDPRWPGKINENESRLHLEASRLASAGGRGQPSGTSKSKTPRRCVPPLVW
jgi:prolipoprotein diacylglyceryl transferase